MPDIAQLDRAATGIMRMFGDTTELVTYCARATVSATPVDHAALEAHVEQYSDHAVAMAGLTADGRPTVLREDRQLRIRTALVTWTPTLADEVVRSDGSHWRVMSIRGGPGNPFYLLQGRKIS
jgi:hypothetical protein